MIESQYKTPVRMTLVAYLLTKLAEECNEVAQRCHKAQCFTLEEVQPGQELTNEERIAQELNDLFGTIEVLQEAGVKLPGLSDRKAIDAKKAKLRKFLAYSRERLVLIE